VAAVAATDAGANRQIFFSFRNLGGKEKAKKAAEEEKEETEKWNRNRRQLEKEKDDDKSSIPTATLLSLSFSPSSHFRLNGLRGKRERERGGKREMRGWFF
jgi:hypothetical protein